MHFFNSIMTELHIATALRAALLLLLGIFIARTLSVSIEKILRSRLKPHPLMVTKQIIFYTIVILFFTSAVQELGFHIETLLGATGIITIALGIASQTSISNFVSGIFILGERPFEVGDTIKVNDVQGEVLSIDFLSVKIRTNDNTMVRIPNESLIKSPVSNLSYFPIRRIDVLINIADKENLARVKTILLDISAKNPQCLNDPAPTVKVDSFGESAVVLQFCNWTNRENFKDLKNILLAEIKEAFDKNNIEMPYPCRTLVTGNNTHPLPVKII